MNQTKPTLIFDMDGVILDTEQLVRRCWNEIAPEFHADAIDAVFLTTVGTTRVHTCSILRERYGADFPAEEFNNAVRFGKMCAASVYISWVGGRRSGTIMGRIPAACAARMPLYESSMA